MWCIMMYSTGLPILYLCGFFFFFIFYWVYKILLLKFYKRTDTFTHDLPLSAADNIPISLLIHLCFGAYIISNSQMLSSSSEMRAFVQQPRNLINYMNERLKDTSAAESFYGICILICCFMFIKSCVLSRMTECCGNFFDRMTNCCLCVLFDLSDVDIEELTSQNFYQELDPKFLKEIYVKATSELKELKMMQS